MTRTLDAVILTYHSISKGPSPLCIPPDVFAGQMSWLKANAHVVPLTVLVESLAHDQPMPQRTVALTFDDGFADFYTEAAPTLRRLELTAVVFLPAAHCGRIASWDVQAGGRPLMSWAQIRELAAQGLSFGSHSMTHPALISLTDTELAYELAESKRSIEAEIGQDVRFFCYPYGCFDERTRRAVTSYYSGGACSTNPRALARAEDLFTLPRIDAHYVRNFAMFRSIFTGRFRLYLCARRFMRNLGLWIRSTKRAHKHPFQRFMDRSDPGFIA